MFCADTPAKFFTVGMIESMDLDEGRPMGRAPDAKMIKGLRLTAVAVEWHRTAAFFGAVFNKDPCTSVFTVLIHHLTY